MVNQLLAKIDGVEQLNNILVIGKSTPDYGDIEFSMISTVSGSVVECYSVGSRKFETTVWDS